MTVLCGSFEAEKSPVTDGLVGRRSVLRCLWYRSIGGYILAN
jgi:hypothetical protein